jgi:hypothetical protein
VRGTTREVAVRPHLAIATESLGGCSLHVQRFGTRAEVSVARFDLNVAYDYITFGSTSLR